MLGLLLAVAACAADQPPATKPIPARCAQNWFACASGACCPESYTCGGAFPSVGCPAGSCCYVGGSFIGDRRPNVLQR